MEGGRRGGRRDGQEQTKMFVCFCTLFIKRENKVDAAGRVFLFSAREAVNVFLCSFIPSYTYLFLSNMNTEADGAGL